MRTSAGVDVAIVVERVQQRVSFIHVCTVSELRRPRKTKSLHVLLAHTVFLMLCTTFNARLLWDLNPGPLEPEARSQY